MSLSQELRDRLGCSALAPGKCRCLSCRAADALDANETWLLAMSQAMGEQGQLPFAAWPELIALWRAKLDAKDAENARLREDLLQSIRSGHLFGNHDEPLDEASVRILRVIHQRLTRETQP